MFLKIGNLILNTDHIVKIGFGPDGSASVQLNSDRAEVIEHEGEHAVAIRAAFRPNEPDVKRLENYGVLDVTGWRAATSGS